MSSPYKNSKIKLVKHARGAPGLRLLGLGPNLIPLQGLNQLQKLFNAHAFWAKKRNFRNLKQLLAGSSAIVSLWSGNRMIGFGRGTSDGIYRAVLWDVVVADDLQRQGLGKQVVNALLSMKPIRDVERIYLMTTNSSEFYRQLGFENKSNQNLLLKENQK